jgi:hypothetical protein
MADTINEGAYRISGRFGEGYFIDPTGQRAPMKIVEATEITFTTAIADVAVQLSGGRQGSKDGSVDNAGQMVIQQIDAFFENIVFDALPGNLDERRAARDAGQRIARTFTLQVWQDDPEALGAIGYQLEAVRLRQIMAGFSFGDDVTSRTHPFRYDTVRKIRAFERIGNSIDPSTGLPSIRYTDDLTLA